MAPKKKDKIESKDITGLKYFDKLAPLLERLHDEGCQRDKAGNRDLHFDQYCLLILLGKTGVKLGFFVFSGRKGTIQAIRLQPPPS